MTTEIDRIEPGPVSPRSATRSVVLSRRNRVTHRMRVVAVFGAIGTLVAGIALPAFARVPSAAEATVTLQQLAVGEAQSLVVASDVESAPLAREAYSATSQAEVDEKRAAAEAARKAREAAAARVSVAGSINVNLVAPGSGAVRWPLTSYTWGPRNTFQSAVRPNHNGFDMLAPARTPIFAVADGVVRVSSESHFGYGVAVVIDHVIGGQRVTTTYGHMTYGTRVVSVGQRVKAGQIIGLVGSTGRSTANHLHIEVRINGGLVDPQRWLRVNAG